MNRDGVKTVFLAVIQSIDTPPHDTALAVGCPCTTTVASLGKDAALGFPGFPPDFGKVQMFIDFVRKGFIFWHKAVASVKAAKLFVIEYIADHMATLCAVRKVDEFFHAKGFRFLLGHLH